MNNLCTAVWGLACVLLVCVGATGVEEAQPITVENVREIREFARFDVGVLYFQLSFLSGDRLLTTDSDQAVFWDLEDLEPIHGFARAEAGRVVGLSPDRTLLALYTALRRLEVWSVDPLERVIELCAIERTDFPWAVFSPDQRLLAVSNRWNDVEIWNIEGMERLHNLTGHASNLFSLAFSPDGALLAAGSGKSGGTAEDSRVKVWDVATGVLIADLLTPDIGDNHAITFTLDGERLLSTGNYRFLAWDTGTWERVHDSGPSYPGSYGISLSPDGRLLAIATDNRRLRLVDTDTMRSIRDIYVGVALLDVDFSLDGSRLAASFADGTAGIWGIP